MNKKAGASRLLAVAAVIAAVTVLIHWPVVHNGLLLQWDDRFYLDESRQRSQLSWETVKWALTTVVPFSYQPLFRLANALYYHWWGMEAPGYHATSVLLHGLNAGLVTALMWIILRKAACLTDAQWLAMASAIGLVFGIHPLQVESVAFFAQQITLLSSFFMLGATCAYFWFTERAHNWRWRVIVTLLFVAALLSKATAVSWVLLMLVMDFYPLRRHVTVGWRGLLKEKLLWFAVCAGMSGLFLWAAAEQHGLVSLVRLGPIERCFVAVRGSILYIWMLAWPTRLSPYYPLQAGITPGQGQTLELVAAFAGVTILAIRNIRRAPGLPAACSAYLVLLLPVTGVLQVGGHAMADRYMYLAMLPLLAGGAYGFIWLWKRAEKIGRAALLTLFGCWLAILATTTRAQIAWWRNDEGMWRIVLARYPDCVIAHWQLAKVLTQNNQVDEAIAHLTKAIRIKADFPGAHYDLGLAYSELGKPKDAIAHYRMALQIKPDFPEAHFNWGFILATQGKWIEAVEHYQSAVRINRSYPDAHSNLGVALAQIGRGDEAVVHLREALRLKPDDAETHNNLGIVLAAQGDYIKAIAHYVEAVQLAPEDGEIHNNMGVALDRHGEGRQAVAQFQEAVRLRPDWPTAMANLAWTLATSADAEVRDGHEAVRVAQRACELSDFEDPQALDTLAAAYAEVGRWADAVQMAQNACDLARVSGRVELATAIQQRVDSYKATRPYRQIVPFQEHL